MKLLIFLIATNLVIFPFNVWSMELRRREGVDQEVTASRLEEKKKDKGQLEGNDVEPNYASLKRKVAKKGERGTFVSCDRDGKTWGCCNVEAPTVNIPSYLSAARRVSGVSSSCCNRSLPSALCCNRKTTNSWCCNNNADRTCCCNIASSRAGCFNYETHGQDALAGCCNIESKDAACFNVEARRAGFCNVDAKEALCFNSETFGSLCCNHASLDSGCCNVASKRSCCGNWKAEDAVCFNYRPAEGSYLQHILQALAGMSQLEDKISDQESDSSVANHSQSYNIMDDQAQVAFPGERLPVEVNAYVEKGEDAGMPSPVDGNNMASVSPGNEEPEAFLSLGPYPPSTSQDYGVPCEGPSEGYGVPCDGPSHPSTSDDCAVPCEGPSEDYGVTCVGPYPPSTSEDSGVPGSDDHKLQSQFISTMERPDSSYSESKDVHQVV